MGEPPLGGSAIASRTGVWSGTRACARGAHARVGSSVCICMLKSRAVLDSCVVIIIIHEIYIMVSKHSSVSGACPGAVDIYVYYVWSLSVLGVWEGSILMQALISIPR